MKRVLFIDHVSRILGGAEINLIELLNCPDSRCHWQVGAAVSFDSPLQQRLEKSGAQLMDYRLSSELNQLRLVNQGFPLFKGLKPLLSVYKAIKDLTEICREFKPDILVSCTNKDHFISGWVGRRLGISSVWWVNDVMHPDFFSMTIRTIFRFLAGRNADHLITVSDFAMRNLIELGIPESKIQCIHNGIPIETYQIQSELRFGLKAELGISEDNPIIGFIGRLTPWKGPDFFLDLADRWIQEHPKGHFLLVV
ncbi:MAG TPA: hypothetical protein EYG38_10785 [Verrucomicrobia bacterium]|nr:hypothetical protein [Verrucomicrobiota bacterium]